MAAGDPDDGEAQDPGGAGPRPDVPGAFVISITPFDRDGALDEAALAAHLRRIGRAGLGVYVAGGGSGEAYSMSTDEVRRVLQVAVAELKGVVPVRGMGVEPRRADDMVRFAALAEEAGLDAVQIYSLELGHGERPVQREIRRYYDDVLSATDLPAVLSTHMSVGYLLPVPLIADLVAEYDIAGINCTAADMGYVRALIDAVEPAVPVHVGVPGQAFLTWAAGGSGFLTSEANLIPETAALVARRHRAGDHDGAIALYDRFLRIGGAMYEAGGIRANKCLLNELGLAGGYPRLPRLPVTMDDPGMADLLAWAREPEMADREGWGR
ncbi:MAG TPA: dihydrodipicolinate synthase family protein [Acidimicrobiales bacterium]|nr:dihydrodipicolinate synthase family protein [Acidimicrobiales bacterium]